ncbi:MAG: ABC transporter ATP-binding protein, partial [Shimia sp.]|nr:ABC transporter ATP-binding protein [Shimia sp.]
RQLLTDIRDQYGVGILIVEHDLPLIMTMCDHIMVINRGRMIAEGTPEEVQSNPEVIDAYIGSDPVEEGASA